MPKSRNRKKHKTALAKRNKAIKVKKEQAQKNILKWMAQMEEMKKKQLQNPLAENTAEPNIAEAEIVNTEPVPDCLPVDEQIDGESK